LTTYILYFDYYHRSGITYMCIYIAYDYMYIAIAEFALHM